MPYIKQVTNKRNYRSKSFDYSLDYKKIDFRKNPKLYSIGKGEQGVLMVEPYKSEILPFWKFKTPEIAEKSARKIYHLFQTYKRQGDFVGMDMARKFLQMGYTRSRRYANHATGKKYMNNPEATSNKKKEARLRKNILPQEKDWGTNIKAQSARIFYEWYLKARNDKKYLALKIKHQSGEQ